jgi:hypothetical protein
VGHCDLDRGPGSCGVRVSGTVTPRRDVHDRRPLVGVAQLRGELGGLGLPRRVRYEGTFANAEAVAKRHQVPADAPPSRKKTGGWLAISNVAYFFSFASTPAEVDRVTACLTKTYPGKPKWPANVSLSTLSSPESPYT